MHFAFLHGINVITQNSITAIKFHILEDCIG